MSLPVWAKAAAYAAVLGAMTATPLAAATVTTTIKLQGAKLVAGSHLYSAPGLGLKVTGHLFNTTSGVLKEKKKVTRTKSGLGIKQAGEKRALVDGKKGREILRFKFDTRVKVKRIVFTYFDSADDFELIKYNGQTVVRRLEQNLIVQKSTGDGFFDGSKQDIGRSILASNQQLSGRVFGIGADFRDDDFQIKTITVSYDDGSAARLARDVPASVPLPAAGFLMLAGLGAFGLVARRRR